MCRRLAHQADPADPGLGHGTLAHLGGLLSEEEVELVIVLLAAVWDEVCVDECGICGEVCSGLVERRASGRGGRRQSWGKTTTVMKSNVEFSRLVC